MHRRQPSDGQQYYEHPDALGGIDVEAKLRAWGSGRNTPRPLDEVHAAHLARLRSGGIDDWAAEVTGKAVLKVFLRALSSALPRPIPAEMLVSIYLDAYPSAHRELGEIVDAILADAGT